MAVTLTKKFWTGSTYTNVSKIVFTSPNITSPAAAGTRSHILPGSQYIGTWFEAVDFMYRIKNNQNAPSIQECYFAELPVYQPTFDFTTGTTLNLACKYISTIISGTAFQYDRSNYGYFATVSGTGTVMLDGITYNTYYTTLSGVVGTSTISGSTTTASGTARVYAWRSTLSGTSVWSNSQKAIVFAVEFGEAYNCRLTAWDDDTHTTTDNKVLSEEHYRVTACAYKAGGNTKQNPTSNNLSTNMVVAPGIDIPLKGNDAYYGDFDLIFIANGGTLGTEHGEYLIFTPRLVNMDDSFTSGNYDFVTTIHYQYT